MVIPHSCLANDNQSVHITCPSDLKTLSDKNLETRYTDNTALSPEEYTCYATELWRRNRLKNGDYFVKTLIDVESRFPEREDLQVYILQQTARLPYDNYERHSFGRFLAEIYARPQSPFYTPEEARRLYLQVHSILFANEADPAQCFHTMTEQNKTLQTTAIEKQVLSEIASWCTLPAADLINKAKDLEHNHKFVALKIYEKLSYRLDLPKTDSP